MKLTVGMLVKRRQELEHDMRKADEDILRREEGVKQERKKRQEMSDLLLDIESALAVLNPKWRAQV